MPVAAIKPTHKALATYYSALAAYAGQQVTHEGALETAFQQLLNETARPHGWMLVPKQSIKRGAKTIIPDGTLRDMFGLAHGYWEAKDTDDDLSAEIQKKKAKGYPFNNTIFEDTRRAVLFQNGEQSFVADLHKPQELADLLNAFYRHTEPDIEGFEQAVDEFKERVPELALALAEKIKLAHRENQKFQAAFAAHPLKRIIQQQLQNPLATEILKGHFPEGSSVRIDFRDGDFSFEREPEPQEVAT